MGNLYSINNKNVVFLAIPKTGGSSIKKNLKPFLSEEISGHLTYDETLDKITKDNIDYFFCVLRNPFDWRSSFYHYVKETHPIKSGRIEEHKFLNNNNYKNYIKWLETHLNENPNSSEIFFRSQSKYFENVGDKLVILRFEKLDEDYKFFMKKLGIASTLNTKINVSSNSKTPFIQNYDEETITIMEKIYHKDFILFNKLKNNNFYLYD